MSEYRNTGSDLTQEAKTGVKARQAREGGQKWL